MNIKGTPMKTSKGIYRTKKGKIKINSEFIIICFIISATGLIFSIFLGIICFLIPFIYLKDETFVK